MSVPTPIKTNEPTKITASAIAPRRVQKVILSRSSIMLGSLHGSPGHERADCIPVSRQSCKRPGVLPVERMKRGRGTKVPASSHSFASRGAGPGGGLHDCIRLTAVEAAYLMILRATMPPATSKAPTPKAKIEVRSPPDCGSDLLSAALTADAGETPDAGAGAGAGGTGAGAAFGAGAGGGK